MFLAPSLSFSPFQKAASMQFPLSGFSFPGLARHLNTTANYPTQFVHVHIAIGDDAIGTVKQAEILIYKFVPTVPRPGGGT